MEGGSPKITYPRRWDKAWIEERLRQEESKKEKFRHTENSHPEDAFHLPIHYRFLRWGLHVTGQFQHGYSNFLDIHRKYHDHFIEGWPATLNGLRILHLSDLHLDLDEGLLPVILEKLQGLSCDLAVFTGDFWEGNRSSMETTIEGMEAILEVIGQPRLGIYGVLGNHDTLELGVELERLGIALLNNEALVLGEGESSFALAGVDDAFYYKTDDLERARARCPDSIPKVLLSHSPQLAPAAQKAGFQCMLSGHTHGGQICLPGGYALITMENIPRPLFRGPWKVGTLSGFTTTGTGACHVPVRFKCPPEIVVHSLRMPARLT